MNDDHINDSYLAGYEAGVRAAMEALPEIDRQTIPLSPVGWSHQDYAVAAYNDALSKAKSAIESLLTKKEI